MDVLEKGSLTYVQAVVLMANYLQKRNKPNAGFVLIGIGFSMALAIGLHREFGLPSTTPFSMELRRRTWWTLFVFVSEAQLTLGRPAVSLVGVNVTLPSNIDDQDLAVDVEQLPEPKDGPTAISCLVQQVRLAKIANMVQVELLTNQAPGIPAAIELDSRIEGWRRELPPFFVNQAAAEPWFEIPKWILLWRAFHLQIVLSRPILFQRITAKSKLDTSIRPISSCLDAADKCVDSICDFVSSALVLTRGLAWYATYWLITASFVQATCFLYDSEHSLAPRWESQVKRAVHHLTNLGVAHDMSLRARDMLQKLLGK
jgi:transcriptional regulatory protein GAL4